MLATGKSSEWLNSPQRSVKYVAVSPDSRWAALTTQDLPGSRIELWLAPLETTGRVSERARWIRITQSEPESPVAWSAASDRLFFIHQGDGHHCLWSRTWNGTKAGIDEVTRHFHSRRRFPWSPWIAVTANRVILRLTDTISNIWSVEAAASR